ncbi:MAG: glycoside hydrolase family 130 protein [Planctomycetota bacterium]
MAEKIPVRRLPLRLEPDPRRTITRFFWPGKERAKKIINRVESIDRKQICGLVDDVLRQFTPGNPGLDAILIEHYESAIRHAGLPFSDNLTIQLLAGAYFSMEYAFESAALFNPSVVPAQQQPQLSEGILNFAMSLRAVGEGHLSSITFRRGTIDEQGNVQVVPAGLEVRQLKHKDNRRFNKPDFIDKLGDLQILNELSKCVMDHVPDTFTALQLHQKIDCAKNSYDPTESDIQTLDLMLWLAKSEYEIEMQDGDGDIENLVLFPLSETESQGMEDMRLVCFRNTDDSVHYYGTYTAYNGTSILPQILEIIPRERAFVHTLHGKFARNKGMALFPQKIDGQFAAIGRTDGENMFLLKSDEIDFWDEATEIIQPKYSWEFVQVGNCGSPLLTDAGWLLLTHGVGAMRKYCIGAVLLDTNDPTKILGQLQRPLLSPNEEESSGYVPNVVYSCGGLIHQGHLLIPYGISDAATGFAVVDLDRLLAELS